jgi:hypothetical protein
METLKVSINPSLALTLAPSSEGSAWVIAILESNENYTDQETGADTI